MLDIETIRNMKISIREVIKSLEAMKKSIDDQIEYLCEIEEIFIEEIDEGKHEILQRQLSRKKR